MYDHDGHAVVSQFDAFIPHYEKIRCCSLKNCMLRWGHISIDEIFKILYLCPAVHFVKMLEVLGSKTAGSQACLVSASFCLKLRVVLSDACLSSLMHRK